MQRHIGWPAMLAAAIALSGCANMQQDSAETYTQGQMRQAQTVYLGRVVSVRPVRVQAGSNEALTLGGAALGGLAGSNVGQGNGSVAGAIVGALAGGFASDYAQKNLNKKGALEITVKLDEGKTVSIVQDADIPFRAGDRVRVLSGRGTDRVAPL